MTHNTEGGAESTELGVNMLMKLEMMCNTGDGDWEYGNGALKITANQGHDNSKEGRGVHCDNITEGFRWFYVYLVLCHATVVCMSIVAICHPHPHTIINE